MDTEKFARLSRIASRSRIATRLYCYRVRFRDGSQLLVDAPNVDSAMMQAVNLAFEQEGETSISSVTNLDLGISERED